MREYYNPFKPEVKRTHIFKTLMGAERFRDELMAGGVEKYCIRIERGTLYE